MSREDFSCGESYGGLGDVTQILWRLLVLVLDEENCKDLLKKLVPEMGFVGIPVESANVVPLRAV